MPVPVLLPERAFFVQKLPKKQRGTRSLLHELLKIEGCNIYSLTMNKYKSILKGIPAAHVRRFKREKNRTLYKKRVIT